MRALDEKHSDLSSRLEDLRLEIDADRGQPVQAGCRAGSALYRLLKASAPRSAALPFTAFILLAQITRESNRKHFAYQVILHALPKSLRPQGMNFQGSYRTSATKLTMEAFEASTPKANGRKSKASTTYKALNMPPKPKGSRRRRRAPPMTDGYDLSSSGY